MSQTNFTLFFQQVAGQVETGGSDGCPEPLRHDCYSVQGDRRRFESETPSKSKTDPHYLCKLQQNQTTNSKLP